MWRVEYTEVPSTPIKAVPLEEAPEGEAEETAPETEVEEPEAEASSSVTVYTISPDGSLVRFELDEDLRGSRKTVVGETDQVAGELAVNLSHLADTQAGTLQINARTLVTDNNFRNRAIRNKILNTVDVQINIWTYTCHSRTF